MSYIIRNLRTRPSHLTSYWVNIRGLFNPTHIDRVNETMTNNIKSTYISKENFNPTPIIRANIVIIRTKPVQFTTFRVNKWFYANTATINRVMKIIVS